MIEMERRNARQTREIVVPGEVLDGTGMKPGENAYVLDGKVRASVMGVPKSGDTVIGVIVDIGPSNWLVDIGAPYPAPLHVNEVPWKVEFGDTSRYLTMGNVVLLKVLSVDESKKIQVTMKDSGLRKLEGGRLVKIPHSKVSRVIGKSGSMISMLKNMTDCRITVGQNGLIWIDGDDENADVAVQAIEMIEAKAQAGNRTDRVKEFIESKLPQSEEYDDEEEGEE